jgi:hypothetical protein
LKRIIIFGGVALAVLGGGGAAFAAASTDFNMYTASQSFSPSAAGSPKHPSPVGFHEVWNAMGLNGHNAAPLTQVVTKMYGIRTNGAKFPTCTANQINNAGNTKGTWNKVCPKGSLIASGPVSSLFVPYNNATATGAPACNPYLSIYNGGKNTQTFFFSEYPFAPSPKYMCLGGAVHTGSAAAYTGTITQPSASNHNVWKLDIPLPASVSTQAGGIKGVYASLIKLDVTYKTLTKKVNGKTIGYAESIGCKNGTRPYSFTFTAQNYQGQSPATQTTTVGHTATCS